MILTGVKILISSLGALPLLYMLWIAWSRYSKQEPRFVRYSQWSNRTLDLMHICAQLDKRVPPHTPLHTDLDNIRARLASHYIHAKPSEIDYTQELAELEKLVISVEVNSLKSHGH